MLITYNCTLAMKINHTKGIILLLTILCAGMSACKENIYKPDGLTRLTHDELIDRARNHNFPSLDKVIFKTPTGDPVPLDSLQIKYSGEEWAMDYYINDNGEIVELVLRKAEQKDQDLRLKIQEAIEEGPPLETVQIICGNQKKYLEKIILEQENRQDGQANDPQVDRYALSVVVSLLDQCGMPTTEEVGEEGMLAIWTVFQHAPNNYRKTYYATLMDASRNGDIDPALMATMEDRILLDDHLPQKYGTQLIRNDSTGSLELYRVESTDKLDSLRASVGLDPIDDYLRQFGLESE